MSRMSYVARRDQLIDRIVKNHGSEGLAVMVSALEAITALRGKPASEVMSAFLSDVSATMPWMVPFAEIFALSYAAVRS